ncbi:N,N-dimethylformamidase beta subunit family domain-containing protein [Paenarthrobacter sp. NPDC092416]|uniref:N,N-dimethylformamidase beta subunit family domain-containing protein n=1 Tax=Paenarthrobacter sp. NPDC092416 TaxID=3364386 RepID=UPI00381C9B52
MKLMGYADELSVHPGEKISFKISSDEGPIAVNIVRLHGVDTSNPDSSTHLVREEALETDLAPEYNGGPQKLTPGSYARIRPNGNRALASFELQTWTMPTQPQKSRQTLVHISGTEAGIVLRLEPGQLVLEFQSKGQTPRRVTTRMNIPHQRWVRISASYDETTGRAHLSHQVDGRWEAEKSEDTSSSEIGSFQIAAIERISLAASHDENGEQKDYFNGRIEDPFLVSRPLTAVETQALREGAASTEVLADELVAAWSFGSNPSERTIIDASANQMHGELINRPTRAVTGHSWTRPALNYRDNPKQWNAIHFHEDDLDDAEWDTNFTLTVSPGTPSGIYAAKIAQGDQLDYIPFYVSPSTDHARVLFIAPTNTYLAYANEHLGEGERGEAHAKTMRDSIKLNDTDRYIHAHRDLGISIYDSHTDGSGACHSSWLRPVLNFRPNYVTWLNAARRHFAADFYITGWLEAKGIAFDVATDEDVHREGLTLLNNYEVVLTGSHPEYPTTEEYNAIEAYVERGGRLMYLGGNGFYWVTSFDGPHTHTLECRRGYSGVRNWTSHPAEVHHSSTGELGGQHLHTGRTSRSLLGVASSAAGWGKASGYTRTEASRGSDVSFAFDGIDDTTLGNFGLILDGAAGDEVDSADFHGGTPSNAKIILTSRQGPEYYPFVETVMAMEPGVSGPDNPEVRSDVVIMDTDNGGRVFSVGSICWAGSMAYGNYDNNISRLTENVIREFLK